LAALKNTDFDGREWGWMAWIWHGLTLGFFLLSFLGQACPRNKDSVYQYERLDKMPSRISFMGMMFPMLPINRRIHG
jgi:hypothetical protein